MKHRTLLSALALATLVVGSAPAQEKPNPLQGKALPAFSMKGIDGKPVTNATIKGKVAIFDFWATWCGPCMKASPLMDSLYKKYGRQGLVVIGAKVLDDNGSAVEYKKKHGYSYLFTTGGETLMQPFGFKGIPAFVIVGRDGKVAKVQMGYGPELDAVFEKTVKSLLAAR